MGYLKGSLGSNAELQHAPKAICPGYTECVLYVSVHECVLN